ncbi:MAG: CBS domain-containing protein [Planctomycetes bacterium]|nr:CBS domain-containing protein [Planctomycetota bacterium]
MKLLSILSAKGREVYTTQPEATLQEVVDQLVRHNCGSLVVVDEPGSRRLLGIITERDILRTCAENRASLDQLDVASAMSTDVMTVREDDSVAEIMGLMTRNRFRHMPVIEDGQLAGIISIGDVVKAQHDALTQENHYLKSYIHG